MLESYNAFLQEPGAHFYAATEIVTMKFEWGSSKAAANLAKHGVSFDEGATVFLDPLALSGPDPEHSSGESRYITFGLSSLGRLIVVRIPTV